MDLKNLTSLTNLSENIKETPEGYLLCCDVWLTMVGELFYNGSEFSDSNVLLDSDGKVKLIRTSDGLNNEETLGSFTGKPVTFNHPDNFVNVDNWKDYAVGTIVNPRFNGQAIEADLLITDPACIELIKSKSIRQVSAGINHVGVCVSDGVYVLTEIRGNHVALVKEGRAGIACSIVDSKEGARMGSLKKQLLDLLTSVGLMVKQADELEEAREVAVDSAIAEKKEVIKESAKDEIDESDMDDDVVEDSKKDGDCEGSEAMDSKYVSKDELKAFAEDMKSFIKDSMTPKVDIKDHAVDSVVVDDLTMAKAEVLSPGIRAQSNIKGVALDAAYKTAEGKEVIDSISGGVVNDYNRDAVFNAAYALLKEKRKTQLTDSLSMRSTAQDKVNHLDVKYINAQCEQFWKEKGVK